MLISCIDFDNFQVLGDKPLMSVLHYATLSPSENTTEQIIESDISSIILVPGRMGHKSSQTTDLGVTVFGWRTWYNCPSINLSTGGMLFLDLSI